MKKKMWVMLLTMALAAGFAAVYTSPSAADEEPVIIGVPTSLYTPFGREGLKAVKMAVEEINTAGGVDVGGVKRPFKIVVSDTRGGEPGTPVHDALMAYEKLITEEKPHAIVIGAFRSEVLIASMDLVAKYEVPQLGTIAQTPGFQKKFMTDPDKYRYLFRVCTDAIVDANYISHTMDYLKNEYGLDKVYFIPQDTLWAVGFIGILRKHCANTGWEEIGYEPYAAGATDFSPGLTKAKERDAQVLVMVWDVPLGAGIFAKQWASMKVPSLPVGFIPPMASPAATETLGEDIEYSIHVEFPVGASLALQKLPKTGEFLDKFKEQYGDLPEAAAVNSSAYDAVYILANAIERAGSLDSEKLVAALEETDYRGVSGRIRFNDNHIAVFGETDPEEHGVCVVFQWQKNADGELVRVPVYPDFLAEGKVQLPPWMK